MAETKIEWADFSFNPWIGCTKVSPACAHCYAERDFDHRYGKVKWGPNGTRVLTSDANWKEPVKWERQVAREFDLWSRNESLPKDPPRRKRVFCASLADVFEDWDGEMKDHHGNTLPVSMQDVRNRLFDLIDATPHLDWLLLTKRPENIARMWPATPCDGRVCDASVKSRVFCPHDSCDVADGIRQGFRKNVWLGCSVENQEQAEKRIPELLNCRNLSPVLFLSCEPMLGPVDLWYPSSIYPNGPDTCCSGFECGCRGLPIDPPAWVGKQFAINGGIDWVIAGGESGPNARPSHVDWFRSIRDQCATASVPFFLKQLSQAESKQFKDFDLFPSDLKVREVPE